VSATLTLACATDEAFAPHCATMLHSALSHTEPAGVHVHVLHGPGLTAGTLERLQGMVRQLGAGFGRLPVADASLAGFSASRFNIACWYRVLLPELLPSISRVLYLDADMVVRQDLAPLWETDLRGKLFGAVINPLYPFMPDRSRELGLPGPPDYLNSGLLLMDLAAMRRADTVAGIRDYARQHPENPWPEQDALSVTCRGAWLPLHPRWNAQSSLFDLPATQLPLPPAQVEEARRNPAVVHFIGPHKPWHYLCRHPLRHLYAAHRRQTPWPSLELEGRTWRNRLLRPFSLGAQLKIRAAYRRMLAP
jgi:lipopolysaccharide biosynthesis glycosyltransferase